MQPQPHTLDTMASWEVSQSTALKELESIAHVLQLYKCQTALWNQEEAKTLPGFLE